MHLILDNFWKILFILLIAVAGWFTWQWKKGESDYGRRVDDIVFVLGLKECKPEAETAAVDARYWKALKKIHDYRDLIPQQSTSAEGVEKGGLKGFLKDVAAKSIANSAGPSAAAEPLASSLQANFELCLKLGIFNDAANKKLMAEGQAPFIQGDGPLKGEKLCIVRGVPGFFAREARSHPANFILMPKPFADARLTISDKFVFESAGMLKRAGVVAGSTLEALNLWVKQFAQ